MASADVKNIILLYESEIVFNRFRHVFGANYKIYWGKDLNTTMEILSQCDVGVMICDIHFHDQDIYPVVQILKHMHPDLVTMIVSQSENVEAVRALEKEEEIFAALVRPVSFPELRRVLERAFAYYFDQRKAEAAQIRAEKKAAEEKLMASDEMKALSGLSLSEALNAKAKIQEEKEALQRAQEEIGLALDGLLEDLPNDDSSNGEKDLDNKDLLFFDDKEYD